MCSLYRTLLTGANLAIWNCNTTGLNPTWTTHASALRTPINTYCWDAPYSAFKDNATATTLHPQDANSMAILFDVVDTSKHPNQFAEKLDAHRC